MYKVFGVVEGGVMITEEVVDEDEKQLESNDADCSRCIERRRGRDAWCGGRRGSQVGGAIDADDGGGGGGDSAETGKTSSKEEEEK